MFHVKHFNCMGALIMIDTILETLNLSLRQFVYVSIIAVLFIIILVLIIRLFIRQNKYFKKQGKLMKMVNNESIENALIKNFELLKKVEESNRLLNGKINKIEDKLSHALQNEGIVKFSAMAEVGGEISYSAAVLDDNDTGFVITGLYYRDGMNTFVKEIINGDSKSNLSPEERRAIAIALEQKEEKKKLQ